MKLHAPWHRRLTHRVRNECLPFTTGRVLYCYQSSMHGKAVATHTWRCAEVQKVHCVFLLLRQKGRFPEATVGLVIPHQSRSLGLFVPNWSADQQKQIKPFWLLDFHLGCQGHLYLLELHEERGWQNQTPPTAPKKSKASFSKEASQFLQRLVLPGIPRMAAFALLVLQNNCFPPKAWGHGHANKPY